MRNKKLLTITIAIMLMVPQPPALTGRLRLYGAVGSESRPGGQGYALRPKATKEKGGIGLEPDYYTGMPSEVISIVRQFKSLEELEKWLDLIMLEVRSGGQLTKEALSFLEIIALLFGFESKPDKGLLHSKASIFKNLQIDREDKERIHEAFYSSERYEHNEEMGWEPDTMWETMEAQVYKALQHILGSNDIRLFSRIKQYKSLILKLERIIEQIEGTDTRSTPLSVAEIIKKTMEHRSIIAADPIEHLDDILGFAFIIDDTGMNEEDRAKALTIYSDQVESALKSRFNIQTTKLRKESRVPGFEAVNLWVQGWLNHRELGTLGVKIQFRFKTALYYESEMYYVYKKYGRWELPPWAEAIKFDEITSFQQLQETLFANFKKYFETRELATHFSIRDALSMPSGWPSFFDLKHGPVPEVVRRSAPEPIGEVSPETIIAIAGAA